MRIQRLTRNRAVTLALATVTVAFVAGAGVQGAQAAPSGAGPTKLYIVQTDSAPTGVYEGGIAGYQATKPAEGERFDSSTAAAKAYTKLLTSRHDNVLRKVGATGKKRSDLSTVFDGFIADLTEAQAAQLSKTAGVVRVWENKVYTVDTTTTPKFLGLSGDTGVWQQRFGGAEKAGQGIIIGDIDSGIWPENPAFAALPTPRPDQWIINHKWRGVCDAGTEEPITCNNKLIGARYYPGFGNTVTEDEFVGPRDLSSHGTHTASTAAGNYNVPATINGGSVGSISGMAPAARIAVYKALWEKEDRSGASGTTAGLVQAINDAVADGVDIINYSISGSTDSVVGPDEVAFRNAAAAGVFISTSAGNSGDSGPSTVAHNSPWTTTVAASSHDRGNQKSIVLGNGATYTGVGVVPAAVASTGLVNAKDIVAAGQDPAMAELCMPGTLDPALAAGKIVICTRGINARVEKSAVVAAAGGVGAVLANSSASQTGVGDFHAVPTVHVSFADGVAIKAYVASAGAGATASLTETDPTPVVAPVMAGFSSYGPALAGGGDLLKPDITAPGVDVIAATSPASDGNNFNALSGTSMSAPHISGLAALIMAKHPLWPPMWVKSAIMTTAYQTDNAGNPIQTASGDATPLNYGAGHVDPTKMFDPGLVYSSRPRDWDAYACAIGQTPEKGCASAAKIDPSDLNYPSIAIGDITGEQVVKRTVTNTTTSAATYKATVTAPAGFTVTVSPSSLTLGSLQSKSFTVKITRTTAPQGAWAFGSLTWTQTVKGKTLHAVRSPIAVRPVPVAAPLNISATGSGTTVKVKGGYAGTLTSTVSGLVPAAVTGEALDPDGPEFSSSSPAASTRTTKITVTVPDGGFGRVQTFDADYAMGTDIDVFAYVAGTANEVAESAGGTAAEVIDLGPGTYDIYYTLFDAAGMTTVKGHSWAVAPVAAGNFTATPASQPITVNGTVTVTLSWTGLVAGTRYLGVVTYGDGTAVVGQTVVTVS
ncbi:S8 family serine peptidase [Catellatospora tritici]|uniref:S8 family serine peptidase n=1 Tax=Catellatospora tritici TaxID=2851566 RepID=UPI001C2CFEA2|nr:S8 family serine peptidase [Catellatospora tritici]MBV1849538.1 S8 family serine peptidase [Catellatospora tritici]MBV1854110.1 S8 family serine peptidase [Catellatospora tritici]